MIPCHHVSAELVVPVSVGGESSHMRQEPCVPMLKQSQSTKQGKGDVA